VFLEVLMFRQSPADWRFVATSTLAEGMEMSADGSLDAGRCVDVLCALGILPAHLSSAFAAGRESVHDRIIEYHVMVPGLSGQGLSTSSTVEAFRGLGWWRRRGHPEAWLERRFCREPTDWERVPDGDA